MTTAIALLTDLATRGIIITAEGDSLKVDAPAGALTAELAERLREYKRAILAHLVGAPAPTPVEPEVYRIPLEMGSSPSEWLAARGLRIVGGAPYYNGAHRPMLFLVDIPLAVTG